ncbi:hypothetical protein E5K63_04685 [Helicobacter pylori]|nr:hypothetical protein E5K63_04685 [Helicobacter pylori]
MSAQNAKFSNNTLKIIEELNNGIKQASEEINKEVKEKATKYEKALQELPKTNALKPLAFSYGDTRRNAFRRANME